jgi:oxygen-independent coproporphyrinogen III oxidase
MTMDASSALAARARRLYFAYQMSEVPPPLRRNSIDYYYLSVYPGLKHMLAFSPDDLPRYPEVVRTAYLHIPFCTGVCSFCSYFLRPLPSHDRSPVTAYLELVKQEITLHQAKTELALSYLYFGGGTPSLIPPAALADLFAFLSSQQALAPERYGTFELHPEFFRDLKAAQEFVDVLREYGINRVSVGVETFNQALLNQTNRRHGLAFLTKAMEFLRDNSFYVNIDLMYGLPGMTYTHWGDSLRATAACAPDSISAYFLFVDHGTPMRTAVERGQLALPTHEEIQVQHIMTQIYLEECGYHELPNDYYAKVSDDPSEYTVDALPSDTVSLPIGPGAYGFLDRTQLANVFSFADYRSRIAHRQSPMWRGCRLDDDGLMRRDVMFSFKNSPHLDCGLFIGKYGTSPVERYAAAFELLGSYGLIDLDDARNRVTLTAKGRLCVEEIACLFRPPIATSTAEFASAKELKLLQKHHFAPTYPGLTEKPLSTS